MERYAHKDQVGSALVGLRADLVGILDRSDIPADVYEAVMAAIEAAPRKYITWASEVEIANEYWDAMNHCEN